MSSSISHDLNTYLNSLGKVPVLTKEAQILHCRKIQAWVKWEGGQENAPPRVRRQGQHSMNVMVRTNLRLVVSVAKKYTSRGLDFADLIQEGNLGLIRGLERFDPSRGYAFTTYSYWWIRQSMNRAIQLYSRSIRIPVNIWETVVTIRKYAYEFTGKNMRSPTTSEIAAHLSIPPDKVQHILDVYTVTRCASLDAPINIDSSIGDLISNPTDSAELSPDLYVADSDRTRLIREAIAKLTPIEQAVINRHFFDNLTVVETSRVLDINRTKVSYIRARALNKLKLRLGRIGLYHLE